MKKKNEIKNNPNQDKLVKNVTDNQDPKLEKGQDPKLKELPVDTISHLIQFLDIQDLSKFNRANSEAQKISKKLLDQRKVIFAKEQLMDEKITIQEDKMISMCHFLLKSDNKSLEVFKILESNTDKERNKLINCLFFTPNEKRYKNFEHVLEEVFPIANCFTSKTMMSLGYGGHQEKYEGLVNLCVLKLLADQGKFMELPEIKMLNEYYKEKGGKTVFSEQNKSIFLGTDELSKFVKESTEQIFGMGEAEKLLKQAYNDADKYLIKHHLKETPGPDLKKNCSIL